jgi:Protein of unknown function (DUF2442)
MRGPVFADALTPRGFAAVKVDAETGTIVWPGGADLAPETLYERVRTGLWPEQSAASQPSRFGSRVGRRNRLLNRDVAASAVGHTRAFALRPRRRSRRPRRSVSGDAGVCARSNATAPRWAWRAISAAAGGATVES